MWHNSFGLGSKFPKSRRAAGWAARKRRKVFRHELELLELRTLLSVGVMKPDFVVQLQGGGIHSSSQSQGFAPSQLRQAYGFDQVTFGGVQGGGSGQTIAIIDAYDDPNIVNDLAIFDQTFGLPAPPRFTKINQVGGTTYPAMDPSGGWELESSIDVEWAHAIAPGASILLVEASSASNDDLYSAVDYARSQPGVSVVSMSFGGHVYSDGSYVGELPTDPSNDYHFLTPSGHSGVTFVAASGDYGAPPQYPATSPNVLAIGGTTLSLNANNSYGSETGWSGSGGGMSRYEPEPAYQGGVQSTGFRANPDVALDADPATGVAVYDSVTYYPYYPILLGASGWYGLGGTSPVGGTSVAAPMWAALVAIADQGRSLLGVGSLDGGSQTLPIIYQADANDFHDITQGNNGYPAGPGYDLVTGRGSPIATSVINDMLPPPSVSLSIASNDFAASGGTDTITATVSHVAGRDVAVQLGFSGTAIPGANYTYSSNTINIPAGQLTGSVVLAGVSDEIEGSAETVVVTVTSVTNGTVSGTQGVSATVDVPVSLNEVQTSDGQRFALFSNHAVYQCVNSVWNRVSGSDVAAVVTAGETLYALTSDGHAVYQYANSGWTRISGSDVAAVVTAGQTLYALTSDGHAVYQYTNSVWNRISGSDVAAVVTAGETLYVLTSDGHAVYQYANSAWTQISGSDVAAVVTAGQTLYALTSDGHAVYQYANSA